MHPRQPQKWPDVGKRHIQTVLSLSEGERLRKLSGFDVIGRLLLQA